MGDSKSTGRNLEEYDCQALDKTLLQFYSELRKENGKNYWLDSLNVIVRDSLLSRAPPYPPRVGHVILKTMCSSQFVCAKRLRKFGCFDRFTFVYLPSILDMRPEDAQKNM